MKSFFIKIFSVQILSLILIFFSTVDVSAGTLSCTTRTSACNGGEVEIFEMEDISNAHAGLSAASYTNLVCCSGVASLGNSCSGTYATALKLSSTTNAHVRQGTLSDYPSATNACISVPNGGSITVAYQDNNCTGYDTTLGSMIGTTNSHVGDPSWSAGTKKICATGIGSGSMSLDIVDSGGTSVPSPSIAMSDIPFSLSYLVSDGILGISSQKIRVDNPTGNPQWSLTMTTTGGPTAFWDGASADYDFNDPTANAIDGGDADSLGGQMTIDTISTVITPEGGCTTTGLSLGSAASFSQGVTDTITITTAGGTADMNCYWDITNIDIAQTIPKEQPVASDYDINMTLTITAV